MENKITTELPDEYLVISGLNEKCIAGPRITVQTKSFGFNVPTYLFIKKLKEIDWGLERGRYIKFPEYNPEQ